MNDTQREIRIENNQAAQRWEAQVGQQRAVAVYQRSGDSVMFTHTEVPEQLEGQGIASRLIQAALNDVRAQGQTVIPLCPFVADYIRRHPAYRELVRPDFLHLVGGEAPG